MYIHRYKSSIVLLPCPRRRRGRPSRRPRASSRLPYTLKSTLDAKQFFFFFERMENTCSFPSRPRPAFRRIPPPWVSYLEKKMQKISHCPIVRLTIVCQQIPLLLRVHLKLGDALVQLPLRRGLVLRGLLLDIERVWEKKGISAWVIMRVREKDREDERRKRAESNLRLSNLVQAALPFPLRKLIRARSLNLHHRRNDQIKELLPHHWKKQYRKVRTLRWLSADSSTAVISLTLLDESWF